MWKAVGAICEVLTLWRYWQLPELVRTHLKSRIRNFEVNSYFLICLSVWLFIAYLLEIVMNELQKLMVTADSFANTSHSIFRCPEVLSVIVYCWDVIANMDITLLLSMPGGTLVTLFWLNENKIKKLWKMPKEARNKINDFISQNLKNKCKKWLGAGNIALTDLLSYILEVLVKGIKPIIWQDK